MKNKKDIINYLVLVGAIVVAFICDTDVIKICSVLFFLSFVIVKEILYFLERRRIENDFKDDVQKQFEAIKRDLNKINLHFLNKR